MKRVHRNHFLHAEYTQFTYDTCRLHPVKQTTPGSISPNLGLASGLDRTLGCLASINTSELQLDKVSVVAISRCFLGENPVGYHPVVLRIARWRTSVIWMAVQLGKSARREVVPEGAQRRLGDFMSTLSQNSKHADLEREALKTCQMELYILQYQYTTSPSHITSQPTHNTTWKSDRKQARQALPSCDHQNKHTRNGQLTPCSSSV